MHVRKEDTTAMVCGWKLPDMVKENPIRFVDWYCTWTTVTRWSELVKLTTLLLLYTVLLSLVEVRGLDNNLSCVN